MSTYTQLQARIADDLNRTDLTTQIQQQILLAVDKYKNERTWFNETSATLASVVGQTYVAAPSDFLMADHLYITISGRNIEIWPAGLDEIIEFRPSTNNRPRKYCFYQNRFELDVPCDAIYSMPLYYQKQLATLSAGSDTNGWTTDGEDLIVWHAEKILYATVIKDTEKANTAQQLENQALTDLRQLRNMRVSSGYTRAHYL